MVLIYCICLAISASQVAQGLDYTYNSQKSQDAADYFNNVVEDYKNSWADKLAGIKHESRASKYLDKLKTIINAAEKVDMSDCVGVSPADLVLDGIVLDEAVSKCNDNIPKEGHGQLEDALAVILQNIQDIDNEVMLRTDGCYGDEVCLQTVDDFAEEQFTELKKAAVPEITRASYLLYTANLKSISPCIADETEELAQKAKNAVNSIKSCVNKELPEY